MYPFVLSGGADKGHASNKGAFFQDRFKGSKGGERGVISVGMYKYPVSYLKQFDIVASDMFGTEARGVIREREDEEEKKKENFVVGSKSEKMLLRFKQKQQNCFLSR